MEDERFSHECCVCREHLAEDNSWACYFCGGRFHQPWSVEQDSKSCGQILFHQEAQGLVFLCLRCVNMGASQNT